MKRGKKKKDSIPKLWQYLADDITTWKYRDCIIGGSGRNLYVSRWINNPYFKYGYIQGAR